MRNRSLQFDEPITVWDEALPLGNGQMGMLVWGEDRVKLSLDRVDIWDNRPAPETQSEEYTYAAMVRAYRDRDGETIERLFNGPYHWYPAPTKLLAGRIELMPDGPVTFMRSTLHLETAEARVTVATGREESELRGFVHAVNGYARIRAGGHLNMTIVNPPYGLWDGGEGDEMIAGKGISAGRLEELKYPPAKIIAEGAIAGFIQATREEFQYAVLAMKHVRDGVTLGQRYRLSRWND
jgi:alpha-L-fucosidase 2